MFLLWIILCISIIGYSSVIAEKHEVYIRPGVVRPCNYTDWDCIRGFFTKNSACIAVYGPTPDPIAVPYSEKAIPHANVTFIYHNGLVSGLNNAVIREFYINKSTGKFVLEVEFPEIVLSTSNGTIRYYLRGREPVERSDAFYLVVRDTSITMIVPYTNGIDFSEGQVYTYVADSNVSYKLGRNFISSDPGLQRSLVLLLANMRTTLQEVYLTVGQLYLSIFIESKICKFTK